MVNLLIMLVAIVVILLIAFLMVLRHLGTRLPETHTVSSQLDIPLPRPDVFDIIADFENMKNWPNSGITSIEKIGEEKGLPVVRQVMGRNSFVLHTTDLNPPTLIQRTISDDKQYYSGHWTYELSESANNPNTTTVKITEVGTIPQPLPRAIMNYAIGLDFYLKRHLKSLAAYAALPLAK